jgi:hypothetical protein
MFSLGTLREFQADDQGEQAWQKSPDQVADVFRRAGIYSRQHKHDGSHHDKNHSHAAAAVSRRFWVGSDRSAGFEVVPAIALPSFGSVDQTALGTIIGHGFTE